MFFGPPLTPGPFSARLSQARFGAIHDWCSFSNPAVSSTASPHRAASGSVTLGAVPARNQASTVFAPLPGRRPVHGSTATCSGPSAWRKPRMPQPLVASSRKPCHT